MKKFICLFLLNTLSVFACDNPYECASKDEKNIKVQTLELQNYIKQRHSLLNTPVKVKGKFHPPRPCPKCPPKAMCKPCPTAYFYLNSADGKSQIGVNFSPAHQLKKELKGGQAITVLIEYRGERGYGVNSPFGFFVLKDDTIY